MREVDPDLLGEPEERAQLRGVLRDFLAATSGPDDVRKHMTAPRAFDEALWSRMAGELGLQGLAVPEEYGGSGFSFAELAVVLEEAGRALLCAPLLPTVVLAAHALLLSGDRAACARHLPAIASGARTATVAGFEPCDDLAAPVPPYGPDGPGRADGPGGPCVFVAERRAAGWVGSGEAGFVLDGHGADLILLVARTAAGPSLFACEAGAPGLSREPRTVLDGTRPQARVTLRDTPLTPVGEPGEAAALAGRVLDLGRAALAAEQVGGSSHALDVTVAYVTQRRQFGRQIGSFQAVKHRLADLLVEVEAARSAAAYAAACAVSAPDALPVAAGAAQVVCSETFRRAAAEYVQLHGGIGFTWEHPAHLYVRRARSAEALFGTANAHRARLARLIGLTVT